MKNRLLILLLLLVSFNSFADIETISKMENRIGDKITVICEDNCSRIKFILDRKVGPDVTLNSIIIKSRVEEIDFSTKNKHLTVTKNLLKRSSEVFVHQFEECFNCFGEDQQGGADISKLTHDNIFRSSEDSDPAFIAYTPLALFYAELAHIGIFLGHTVVATGPAVAGVIVAPFELAINLGRDLFSLNSRTRRKLSKLVSGKNKKVSKKVFEKSIKIIENL